MSLSSSFGFPLTRLINSVTVSPTRYQKLIDKKGNQSVIQQAVGGKSKIIKRHADLPSLNYRKMSRGCKRTLVIEQLNTLSLSEVVVKTEHAEEFIFDPWTSISNNNTIFLKPSWTGRHTDQPCLPSPSRSAWSTNSHRSTGKNLTDPLNTRKSFICVLQIPEDLTHDKLNNCSHTRR